jgi:hypothetical protein
MYARFCPDQYESICDSQSGLDLERLRGIMDRLSAEWLEFVAAALIDMPPTIYCHGSLSLGLQEFGSRKFFYQGLYRFWFLPSECYCTDDFLVQLMKKQKIAFGRNEVNHIVMPKYPELKLSTAIRKWFVYPFINIAVPDMTTDEEPSVDADYFFTVVNTAYPHSMDLLVAEIKRNRIEEAYYPNAGNIPGHMEQIFRSAVHPISTKSKKKSSKFRCRPYVARIEVFGAIFEVRAN